MTALTDLSDLINRASGGNSGTPENLWFFKAARDGGAAATAPIAGRPASLWRYDGSPSAGATPTTVAIPDNTTAGGLKQVDPGGGRQKWLVQFAAAGLVSGTLILYDRLLHIGGLSGTTTTAQTVGGTLTRYTDGAGNMAWIEIYTIIGTTATTVTMDYTDQDGNSGQTSTAVAIGGTAFREVSRVIMLPLASGDTGVQAVASVDLLATTGTAGNFGVTIGHPLAYANIGSAGTVGWRDFVSGLPGMPEINTDACLALLWMPASTTAPEVFGCVASVEA